MAARKPLVLVGSRVSQLPAGDTLAGVVSELFQRSETGAVMRAADMKLKQIIYIEDFGGVAGDAAVDNSVPLFNAAMAASANGQSGEVWFTNGNYNFSNPVNNMPKVTLRGSGKNGTLLTRNFNAGSAGVGLLNYTGASASVGHMTIKSAAGVTGGCLISLISGATNSSPDFSTFDNLYLSYGSANSYANCVYINGSARTDNIGVRDVTFSNCDLFGGTQGTVYADTSVNLRLDGSFFKGASDSGQITVTSSGVNDSYYTSIDANNLDGLSLNRCVYGVVTAAVCISQVKNTATARQFILQGAFSAGWQDNWKDCIVSDPTGARTARAAKSARVEPDGTIVNYDTLDLTTSWQTFTFAKRYTSAAAVLHIAGNCVATSQGTVFFQNITATGYDATTNFACKVKIRAEGY